MKYSFLVFATLLFTAGALFPGAASAVAIEQCDEESIECLCPPTVGVDDISLNPLADPGTAVEECLQFCTDAKANPSVYGEVTNYKMQCTVDSVLTPILDNVIEAGQSDVDAYIQEVVTGPQLGVEIPGFEQPIWTITGFSSETNALGQYVQAVYAWLISAGAIVAVLMIMIGGLQWALAAGNPGRVGQARERIVNAVIGLILLMSAYTIAFLIDPNTVAFETLSIDYIEPIDFDFPNETPVNLPIGGGPSTISEQLPVEAGVGWNGVPIFNQQDFANTAYGETACFTSTGGNVSSSGCGVVAYAMAASHLTGQTIDPPRVAAAWSQPGSCPGVGSAYGDRCRACKLGNCSSCNGTFGQAFFNSNLSNELGLEGEPIGEHGVPLSKDDRERVLELLGQGELIVSSYRQPSGNGHYILLVGLDGNGNILDNNPWGGILETRNPDDYFKVSKSFYHVHN